MNTIKMVGDNRYKVNRISDTLVEVKDLWTDDYATYNNQGNFVEGLLKLRGAANDVADFLNQEK